jgi:site-specific DNA-methyltransferase (adenine-specific)
MTALRPGFYNMDCMDGMKQFPDKYFELAIVDPPYGLERFKRPSGKTRFASCKRMQEQGLEWDKAPDKEYFEELERVSQYQIIWGANNFQLPKSEYFVVWDKMQSVDNFASAEYAWTNRPLPAKVFRYSIHQTIQDRAKEHGAIHPTQKPIALYKWLLSNYAKPGDKILDTHVGSASSLIACHQMGFEYWGFELDADYYNAATERLNRVTAQVSLMDAPLIQEAVQLDAVKMLMEDK